MVEFGRLVLKVLVPSFLLSWGIKAIAPQLGIAASVTNALLFVLIPPLAIAGWLALQALSQGESP
jgi:hypothetical protein